jgi:phenylacetate-CoA ligase
LQRRTIDLERLYAHLPVTLQNVACSLEGWRIRRSRYNADFGRRLGAAEARSSMSRDELLAFRDAQIESFVRDAALTVPYYQRSLRALGMEPADIKSLQDLSHLPLLTKSMVQAEPEAFISAAVPRSERICAHTSGTTGAGLMFSTTAAALREQYATWWRHLRRHGLPLDTGWAYFGGRSVVPIDQEKPPFWRTNIAGRQILFSAYHASPSNLTSYLEELRGRKPSWLHGYPSQLALVAAHASETGFELGYHPRWITTSSETLQPSQARAIEAAFGVRPIENYGLAEAAASISQCPQGRLHVDEDFAGVEFLPISDDGLCKIVGTNFSNPATPLLRYDIGDHARLSTTVCDCGLPGRIVGSIDGRQEAYVELANGVRVGRLDHIFKDLVNIREAQIRQSVAGAIDVLVVKGAEYGESDETGMLREFRSRLGDDIRIAVRYRDRIEKTRSGKLRFVVSDLPQNRVST